MGDFAKSIFFPAEFLSDAELLKFQSLLAKLGYKYWTVRCRKYNAKKSGFDRFPPVFINKAVFQNCPHYDKSGNVWCYGCPYYEVHNDSEDKEVSSIEVLRQYAIHKLKQLCESIVKPELPAWRIKAIAKTLQEMPYYLK